MLANAASFDVTRARPSTVQLVLNAVNGSLAGVTQGYASQIIGRFAEEQGVALQVATGAGIMRAPSLEIRSRGWFNSALYYRHYMVPGILVQLATLIGALMTALNIVREKEAGMLEQLNVIPPRSSRRSS